MFRSKKLLKYKKISHFFFNKNGGYSKGIYKSLNCGVGSLDNKINIVKNLKFVSNKVGSSYKNMVLLNQVHSNKFFFLGKKFKNFSKKLKGDALITKERKIILGILTADCAPVLIYDSKLNIIAAIHAGWKGAYKGIVKKVIRYLYNCGSESKNLVAAIGPCISQQSYEIRKDFKSKFLKQSKKNEIFFKKFKKKTYFSLNMYIYYQLKTLGLNKIDIIKKNTYNPKNYLFSARRSIHKKENDYGRNISIIMIN
tara:strand:+ start:1202 stop:1963 length:762 start_codon:yes stop_codon:yes gene_type:complete